MLVKTRPRCLTSQPKLRLCRGGAYKSLHCKRAPCTAALGSTDEFNFCAHEGGSPEAAPLAANAARRPLVCASDCAECDAATGLCTQCVPGKFLANLADSGVRALL